MRVPVCLSAAAIVANVLRLRPIFKGVRPKYALESFAPRGKHNVFFSLERDNLKDIILFER